MSTIRIKAKSWLNVEHIKFNLIFFCLLGFSSCDQTGDISVIPKLWFVSFSKSELIQGDINQDSVWLELRFEDGNGDLGFGSRSSSKDIFVIDKRTNLTQDAYKLPDLPDSQGKPISGTIRLRVYTTCCIFPQGIPPCTSPAQFPLDSLSFEIYIIDRAGNESDRINSPYLYLKCL